MHLYPLRAHGIGIFLVALLVVLLGMAPPGDTAPVQIQGQGFKLTVPADFTASEQLIAANPKLLQVFTRPGADGELPTIIAVEGMGGTIGREHLDPKNMPARFKGRLFTTTWKEFDIDAFEVPETIDGVEYITFNAQVPLQVRAIQLKTFGPASQRAELLQLLNATLATLDGPSNWHTSLIPPSISNSPNYGLLLAIVAGLIVIAALFGLWIAARRSTKGTIFLVGVLFMVAGSNFPTASIRELFLVKASLQLFGVGSVIMGIADFFVRRQRAKLDSSSVAESLPIASNPDPPNSEK